MVVDGKLVVFHADVSLGKTSLQALVGFDVVDLYTFSETHSYQFPLYYAQSPLTNYYSVV